MSSKSEMRLFAFRLFAPSQNWPGMWTHPRDAGRNFNSLGYWMNLARTAERGLFDGIFFADSQGFANVYGGGVGEVVRAGGMAPINDPMMVISAMALATEQLSFGVTGNLSSDHPYTFARRLSTLDHLSEGRFAWNIVTGVPNSGAKAVKTTANRSHDDRYDYADEFMEVVYRLWERSWEDDAAVRDVQSRMYADPAKVHEVVYGGEELNVRATHMCEPSPQRTPVLFQAGASPRGCAFAAKHAECVFLTGPKEQLAARAADIRKRAAEAGRDPDKLLMIAGVTVIVAPTDEEAEAKRAEYEMYVDVRGKLAIESGHLGIDFSQYALDATVADIETQGIQSKAVVLNAVAKTAGWKIKDLADFKSKPIGNPFIVGSPTTVADELIALMDDAGVDGFNLWRTVEPEGLEDFIELVVPVLQARGRFKTSYAEGTMRQKLFGQGDRLPPCHPALASPDRASDARNA